jgi:hypothetical protein
MRLGAQGSIVARHAKKEFRLERKCFHEACVV